MSIQISVIVPFHNQEKYIGQCAESLVNQNFIKENYEIIFVDNGSADTSADIVRTFPEISCIYEPVKGAYAARNKGMSIAKGNIIAFLDSDCAADKNWLQSIHDEVSRNDPHIILGKIIYPEPKSALLEFTETTANFDIQYLLDNNLKKLYYIHTGNLIITRDVFNKIGFFEPIHGEDMDYLKRCLEKFSPLKIMFSENIIAAHLEITSFYIILQKQFKYGYNDIVYLRRKLNWEKGLGDKLRGKYVFTKSVSVKNYSYFQIIYFHICMKIQRLAAYLGRIKGRFLLRKNDL